MAETFALNLLPEGQSAYVAALNNESTLRRRLNDLGLICGTQITCLYRSPAGDPRAYLIRGAVIALRGRDAALIQVNPIPSPIVEASASWA